MLLYIWTVIIIRRFFHIAGYIETPIIKSPQSGVTLCFQFVSSTSAAVSAAATTFASHVKTVWAKP